jgi:hypothetical protein
MGVMIDVPADPTKKILVAYAPNPAVGQPVMQVQLMGVMSGSGGSVPCYGNPWIPFTLSTAQSERVLAQGLPPSLIDELLKTANTNKWTLMPAGGAVGHVELDPDKHFATDTGP